MRLDRGWFAEEVEVRRYAGEGAYGPVLDPPLSRRANVDAARQLVRSSAGDEVVSEVTLHFPPEDLPDLTPESEIVVRGRASQVLTVRPMTKRGDVVYVEVTTT